MVGLGAVGIDVHNERVAVFQRRNNISLINMERTHGGLLCKQSAGNVYFRGKQHLARQLAERQASRPEVRAFDGLPVIVYATPSLLHTVGVVDVTVARGGEITARRFFKPWAYAVGVVCLALVCVNEGEGLLLQRVVPHGVIYARYGVIHETHLRGRGVLGIHGYVDVGTTHAVVPDYGVGHETVLVEVQSASLRGVGVCQVCGRHASVVYHGILQEHPAQVAVNGSIARGSIV